MFGQVLKIRRKDPNRASWTSTAIKAVLLPLWPPSGNPAILSAVHTVGNKSFAEFSMDETKEKMVIPKGWNRTR
ncbi:hypothetical protein H8959_018634 [Pygathrix nigripes]